MWWLWVSSTMAAGKAAGARRGGENHSPWGESGPPGRRGRRLPPPRWAPGATAGGNMAAALRGLAPQTAPVAMATPPHREGEGLAPRSTHAPQPPCPRRARPANCPNSNSHPRRPITARGRGVRPASPPPSGQSRRLLCLKKKCARLIGVAQTSWAYGGRGQFRPPQGDASGGVAWAELAACAFSDPS